MDNHMNQLSSDSLCIYPLIFPAFEKKEEHSFCIRETNAYREISLKIFKELGFQDLCQAKLICREWKQLIESNPLAEDIYRIGLKLAIQKNNPMREKVCAEKLVQEAFCIEKLGDIYLEKGISETLLQAAGLYNYALQIVSDDKKKFFEEKLLKAQHLLINLCQGKVLDNNRIRKEFKSNRQALKSLRRRINKNILRLPESPSPQQVRELYGRIADRMKSFFCSLVNQAIDMLGPAPCEYAMIGFGSLAREEMTPYSDLEFGILIKEDNDANKKYFRNLTNLLHLKVINLGETILPALNIPCLQTIDFFDGITPRGFAFDGAGVEGKGCKTPFGNSKTFELIQTPEKMAQYVGKDEKGQWWHDKEPHLPMELLNFTHLLGDPALTRKYGEKLQEKLNVTNQEEFNLRQYLAKIHLVQADMMNFNPSIQDLEKLGMLFRVKNDFYRFPHLALDRLALFKKVVASDSFTRIDELNKLGIIKNSAAVKLSEWMSIVLFMRLKTYSHYQGQQEMMNPLIKPFGFDEPDLIKKHFTLDLEALIKIKKIYRIFIPFYQAIEEFFAGDEKKLNSSDLEDNSPQTQGNIALRLFEHEDAKKWYNLAKNLNPCDSEVLSALYIIYSREGKLVQAADYVKEALAIDFKLFGENHPNMSRNYINLGMIHQNRGDLKEANKHVKKALSIDLKLLDRNHPIISRDYNNLGGIYLDQWKFEKAAEYAYEALAINHKLYGKNHPAVAICYNNLVGIYQKQGDLKQAFEYGNKALNINLKLFSENHPTVAICYNNLGSIYQDQGDLKKANEYVMKALTIDLKFFGESHLNTGTRYNNLGKIYMEEGNLDKATEYTKKALAIALEVAGENHPHVARCYNNLGQIYQDQGNLDKAAEYTKKALAIDLNIFGEKHPKVAIRYSNLGQIYEKIGDIKQADEYSNKALTIELKSFGENHCNVAGRYNNRGMMYRDQGNLDKAAEYVSKALAITLKIFSKNHYDTATAYANLGMIYQEQGNLDKAAEYSNKAFAIDLRLSGGNHRSVARDCNNLGMIYKEQGNLGKAAEYITKALAISLKLFGENHSDVATIYSNLGLIYKEQGNLGKAAEYITKALAIGLKLLGENHSDVATIYGNLGLIYKEQGSLEKADEYINKALAINLKLFGENHPRVTAINSFFKSLNASLFRRL
jgi:tetratricopeptide (TPR) repeat protein